MTEGGVPISSERDIPDKILLWDVSAHISSQNVTW